MRCQPAKVSRRNYHTRRRVIALQLIVWDASGRPIWDASGHPSSLPGRTTDLTAVGLWEQVDERTGRSQSWFKITERGGVYEGTLVQVSPTCEDAGALSLRPRQLQPYR